MTKHISLIIGDSDYIIELNDTDAANAIWLSAPFEARTNAWGGEIYFEIPVDAELENGKKVLEPGEVAYWPQGRAMCVFYGPTPISKNGKPEAISEVTPIGRLVGDPYRFESVGDRMKVLIRRM
ncbi:MAG: hypothetical protein GX369_00290 [Euryarchaeota archaeon]|nr:hypothetical protein [Euryarchaeota archaeon]